MSELPEVMDVLRRLSFRTNAGCLELVYQEPWETSWGPEPEVLASVPLASLVAVTPPPASVVERDPRTNPQPGDVKLYGDDPEERYPWTWCITSSFQQWQEETFAKGDRWFTREQWAARQKERETKTPP